MLRQSRGYVSAFVFVETFWWMVIYVKNDLKSGLGLEFSFSPCSSSLTWGACESHGPINSAHLSRSVTIPQIATVHFCPVDEFVSSVSSHGIQSSSSTILLVSSVFRASCSTSNIKWNRNVTSPCLLRRIWGTPNENNWLVSSRRLDRRWFSAILVIVLVSF